SGNFAALPQKGRNTMAEPIRCPHCRAEFELTEAVAAQLRDQLRREIDLETQLRESHVAEREQTLARRERELDRAVDERLALERPRLLDEARDGFVQQLKDRDAQILETRSRLEQARDTELRLRREF